MLSRYFHRIKIEKKVSMVLCTHNVRAITIRNFDIIIPLALKCHPSHHLGSQHSNQTI